MPMIYILVATTVIVAASVVFACFFKKKSMLSQGILLAIVISAIAASLAFPFIYGTLAAADMQIAPMTALLISLVILIFMTFLLSIVITVSSIDKKLQQLIDGFRGRIVALRARRRHKPLPETNQSLPAEENYGGKPVDTFLNTDKMGLGIQKNEKEAGRLKLTKDTSLNECIEEAFRLKDSRDLEGAILADMYALDKQPDRQLVFWIVLDICTMYKELGQIELARDILESYVSDFGDIMDASVRTEIEKNLLQA